MVFLLYVSTLSCWGLFNLRLFRCSFCIYDCFVAVFVFTIVLLGRFQFSAVLLISFYISDCLVGIFVFTIVLLSFLVFMIVRLVFSYFPIFSQNSGEQEIYISTVLLVFICRFTIVLSVILCINDCFALFLEIRSIRQRCCMLRLILVFSTQRVARGRLARDHGYTQEHEPVGKAVREVERVPFVRRLDGER